MIKMTCDRCGVELNPNDFNLMTSAFGDTRTEGKWRPTMMVCGTDPVTKEYRRFELCKECEKDLYRLIFDEVSKNV